MTDSSSPSFVQKWIESKYTWNLKAAVLLLHGIDPDSQDADAALHGNSDPARVYAWARKKIVEGELTAIVSTTAGDEQNVPLVLRDDFIEWAHKNYRDRDASLHAAWKAYKASKKKPNSDSLKAKHAAKLQEDLDSAYMEQYSADPAKKFNKSALCRKVAAKLFPGLDKAGRDSKAETIRRYTNSRDLNWVKKKAGNG